MTDQQPAETQKIAMDGHYLMHLCAGGIVKVFGKEMEPATLSAIAAAASAFAALESNQEMAEMKRQIDQLQNDMKLLAMGPAKRTA